MGIAGQSPVNCGFVEQSQRLRVPNDMVAKNWHARRPLNRAILSNPERILHS